MQCSNDAQLSNAIVCGIYGELGIPDEEIPLVMAGHDVFIPTHR